MKIGIMTLYYRNYNYGGQLQAYALCRYLNSIKDIECEVISYDYKREVKRKRGIKHSLFLIYQQIFHPQVMKGLSARKRLFKRFADRIPHSSVYTKQTIHLSGKEYDVVFTGSDQVWNLDYSDRAFFLEFVPPEKRCSYAASFGKNQLESIVIEDIGSILKTYAFLSVREENAKKYLQDSFDLGCITVCDPTLLLSAEQWRSSITTHKKRVRKPYVFVYLLGGSQELQNQIKVFAQKENLSIVYIPHIHFSYQKRDQNFANENVFEAGPWEFLDLIDGATEVITDSFHCCAFSLLFHKQFWAVDRYEKHGEATNTRLKSLLQIVHLENRFITEPASVDIRQIIDYSKVDYYLMKYREQSIRYLRNFLEKKTEI